VPGLGYSQVGKLTRVDTTSSSIERRRAQRVTISCDAELTANLSILDTDAPSSVDSLVFLGRTKDLSAGGLAFVLPSLQIDERFCGEGSRVRLCLYLPTGSVQLEVTPVRCEPLNRDNVGKGYFIAAQILSIDDHRDVYDSYLRSVSR
jgi:PilZ domain